MKIIIDINGIPTEINLTEDQIKNVQQVKPTFNWRDIKSKDDIRANVEVYNEPYWDASSKLETRLNAHYTLSKAIELINEEWTPDWTSGNQPKFKIYSEWHNSKNGFYLFVYYLSNDCHIGSDLHIETKEKAEHILKYFEKEFLELLT